MECVVDILFKLCLYAGNFKYRFRNALECEEILVRSVSAYAEDIAFFRKLVSTFLRQINASDLEESSLGSAVVDVADDKLRHRRYHRLLRAARRDRCQRVDRGLEMLSVFENMPIEDRIIVALDCGRDEAMDLADKLRGRAKWVKIGMTYLSSNGNV